MPFSSSSNSNNIHLIIGGGYISEFHIRASLANKFRVILVELDFSKRIYLKYLFPNISIYSSIQKVLKEFDINKFKLLSVLIPIPYRKNLYEELPEINFKVLIEKPITLDCLKKFNHNQTFICLNQAYNSSGKSINKSLLDERSITKISSLRPNPENLLRQSSLSEYLLDYLPHTITPLHLMFWDQNPSIKILKHNEKKLSGIYLANKKIIDFEVLISTNNFDTFLYSNEKKYSYDNSLLLENSYLYDYKKKFYTLKSIIKNQWGYSTMYKLYSDVKNYLPNSGKFKLLNKLLLKNCTYLAQ